MRFKLTGVLLVAAVVFMAAGAFAQDAPKKEVDTSLKVSGVIYSEYSYSTGYQPGSAFAAQKVQPYSDEGISENKNSTFRVMRVYLNFRKNFSETLSMRVTTDVDTTAGALQSLYLKYAYFQYKDDFLGFLGLNFQAGLIGTPVIGFLDDYSASRWVYQNLLDKSANMLHGFTVDSSADLGAKLSLTFARMITLTGMVCNGEGYKKADGNSSAYDGMAYYGMISINPISELYINGYYRYEQTAPRGLPGSGISDKGYYGAGLAWKSDLINAGLNYWMLWNNDRASSLTGSRTPTIAKRYSLLYAYVMMDLSAVIPTVPILVHGRYSFGYENAGQAANSDTRYKTSLYAFGLGWKFSNNLRVLGYYERYVYSVGRLNTDPTLATIYRDPKPASNFMIKCEVAF